MPRPKSSIPKLCVDRSRNRAFCKVGGKFIVLGPAGSAKAQAAYGQLLANLAQGKTLEAAKADRDSKSASGVTVNDLLLRFATEEMPRYSDDEQWCLKSAIRTTRETFGTTLVNEFGPLRLRLIRNAMVDKGWSRSFTNKQVKRLRLIFRWGVSWELVPPSVIEALATVKSLAAGETDAAESRPRQGGRGKSGIGSDHSSALLSFRAVNRKPGWQGLERLREAPARYQIRTNSLSFRPP